MNKNKDKFMRFKDAEWFEELLGRDIIIGGVGGIGSWLSLLLARIGCNLYLFDFDHLEAHNIGGQLYRQEDIYKPKTQALKEIIHSFCDKDIQVECMGKYDKNSITNDIVMSCFDNMAARKMMFDNWKKQVKNNINFEDGIFIDGRLLAEQMDIFNVTKKDVKSYEKHLYKDEEVPDVACTYQQTSHCAAMIASKMVGFLTNHISNTINKEFPSKQVPFHYKYIIPINYAECNKS